MSELKIIPMRCPACGANLQISEDMQNFACAYCGTQLLAEHKGGTVALKPIMDAIARLQAETDKNAAELAVIRLTAEAEELQKQVEARRMSGQAALEQQWLAFEQQQKDVNHLRLPAIPAGIVLVLVTALLEPRPMPVKSSPADGLAFLGGLLAAAACYVLVMLAMRRTGARQTEALRDQMETARVQFERDRAADQQQLQDLQQKIAEKKRIADA